MVTTINNENQAVHSRRALTNKSDAFSSFNVEGFAVSHGKDEEWKFMPLRKLRGFHNGIAADPVAASISAETADQDGIAVDVVKRDDERPGHAGIPADRVAAQAYSNFDDAHVVTFAKNSVSKESVVIDIDGPGEDNVSYGHIITDVQSRVEAVCVTNYRDSGTPAGNIEFAIGDDAKLSIVTMMNWNEDAVHGSAHHTRVGRDATLRYTVTTFGSEVARIAPRTVLTTSGGDVDLLGVHFVDTGQYFENRIPTDRAVPSYRSNVMYKGALQGEPNVAHREARTAWVGDILIRVEVTGTNIHESNRNPSLAEGAHADAVPNLEIETGEIAGTGHAVTVGRFDEEQPFYPLSRGIPELVARRLVARGFLSEVVNLIPVGPVREKLEKLVDEKFNTAGF